jgi:NAD(P)-dependent dehydrogenase (short-subunit alcohol dehydrogenase family)
MTKKELPIELASAFQRTAIVTGGASGIGQALAEELASRDVFVVVADRQVELGEQVAKGIRERGGLAISVELDVRSLDRFREVVEMVFAQHHRLDFLFNNAGIAVGGLVHDCHASDWNDVIDVNLRGTSHGIQAAYPLMIRQGFGHIVNTASMAGLSPSPLAVIYSATKCGIVGLSRALRVEAGRFGIKVSVLCPGLIRTELISGGRYGRWTSNFDPAWVAKAAEILRPMEPAEFARRAIRAVERNRAIIVEPKLWRLQWYLERISPSLVERMNKYFINRVLQQIHPPLSP